MTVGAEGETLKLLARETTQLGQKLTIEAEGQNHVVTLGLIGAYQAANALTAAGLVIATGGDVGGDARQSRPRAPGARAARAGGDQPGRGAGLCRLCPYAGCDRGGDRGAAAACAASG